ncbi:helix-turn-helix transcriptional regulator [Gordonia hongkongensis]|uniref:helix-turn-helix transcriptional regulator n=1 Tax=Gordonia hongkongensis TaxID=1701090 RepID=UPI001FF88BEF|nr:helix-turn-helix domain-containing protein [Gordonia hongkongensis]UPG66894.1 helix-turn-helix domain-containing protein [Gordonia hongkongensis]
MSSPRRQWASIPQVADHLGLNERTVRRMIAEGRLNGYRNGSRCIRLDLNEVDASMQPFGGAA